MRCSAATDGKDAHSWRMPSRMHLSVAHFRARRAIYHPIHLPLPWCAVLQEYDQLLDSLGEHHGAARKLLSALKRAQCN
jgi:hypothetical protein